MPLLGLELSDAGIMAAGGEPARLLEIEGSEKESPGFAIPQNGQLIVGNDARSKARLYPRLYTNHFWDELSAEPLKQLGLEDKNNAELAYHHLSKIWNVIKKQGNELVIAVPGYFTQRQLGLILGIARELSIPLKGFAAIAVAASSNPYPDKLLFHLDIHLHRIEITFLEQNNYLLHKNTETLPGKGLNYLYAEWVKAVADEFVRTTRFDPFDKAIYEQELYTRMPQILKDIQRNSSVLFSMKAGSQTYHVTLTYDLFAKIGQSVFREVFRTIETMAGKYHATEKLLVVEATHRVGLLPGYKDEAGMMSNIQCVELIPGSGALGILQLKERFTGQTSDHGVAFITSRPWNISHQSPGLSTGTSSSVISLLPTHILYGALAYLITAKPLFIIQGSTGDIHISTDDKEKENLPGYCTVQLEDDGVLLTDYGIDGGAFVDNKKVQGKIIVKRGQTIRIGTSGEKLQLITCVESDEA
ncbi:MAG: hypothetical protein E3K37_15220 [Candidatus Kuenenia sp.]|nr:hypothetical protein [Candidatus Kuenenia hertensis]